MNKIASWTDFAEGKIYNRVYTGPNQAYARVNGKQTFVVVSIKPVIQTQTLFDQFGSAFSDEIRSAVTTHSSPEIAFTDYELFEVNDRTEWFIKSVRVSSLQDALDAGYIQLVEVQNKRMGSAGFTPTFGEKFELKGVVGSYSIDGHTSNPLLQNVYIVWPTWQDLYADYAKYGTIVR